MSIKWGMVYGSIMSVELCRLCSGRRTEQDSFKFQIVQDAFLQIWRGLEECLCTFIIHISDNLYKKVSDVLRVCVLPAE